MWPSSTHGDVGSSVFSGACNKLDSFDLDIASVIDRSLSMD